MNITGENRMNAFRKFFHIREKKLVVLKRVHIVSYDYFANQTLAKKRQNNRK